MIRSFRYVCSLVAAALALVTVSVAAATASPQQTTVQSFVGNWNCVTHTSDGKTYHEADVDTMFGTWIKIDSTYPAQAGQPSARGMGVFGYDSQAGRWYVASADTLGNYSSAYSTSKSLGGSSWHDGYPNNGGSATVTLSKNQFVVDGKGHDMHGNMVTSHEVCTRA